jgi:hypothetical protein
MSGTISDQTARELEVGRRVSAYWAEQQRLRPAPSAKDVAFAGSTGAAVSVSLKPPQ